MSKPTIDVPVLTMLRDRFRDLAEKFASPSLRGIVVEADGEPVSVSIVNDPRLSATSRAEFGILAREAAGRVGDETKHPDGSTPEGRWILFVARSLSTDWPVRHGAWAESSKVDPGDEIFTNIDNLFLSSSVAIDLVLARQKATPAADSRPVSDLDDFDLRARIASLIAKGMETKREIAEALGVGPAFLSRGRGGKAYDEVDRARPRRDRRVSDAEARELRSRDED